jgi:hypothetical protein
MRVGLEQVRRRQFQSLVCMVLVAAARWLRENEAELDVI